jgi:hypothetical protein
MVIFGIGLHRTGTTSLDVALQELGYSVCSDNAYCWDIVHKILKGETPDIEVDCVCEYPLCSIAPLLAVRYPDAKFILTTRALNKWLTSVLRLHAELQHNTLDPRQDSISIGSLKQQHYMTQNLNLQYFKDDPRCLVMPTESVNWGPLCEFLDKPVPDVPFPWLNRLSRKSV